MHNWLFHKNEYTGNWHAVKREDYSLLFNNLQNSKVLSSSSITTLEEIINKTDGDPILIQNLLNAGQPI